MRSELSRWSSRAADGGAEDALREQSRIGPKPVLVWGVRVLAALLIVLLGAWLVTRARHRARVAASLSPAVHPVDKRLPILWDLPPFAFTNIDGSSIDNSTLRGHAWIADFIFTRCTTMCPIITAKMNVLRRSIRSANVRFVSISIEPTYDTPAVLRAYADRWNADPRWLLLSAPSDEVIAFAKSMRAPFERTTMQLEPILHSTLFFLIDQCGRVRGLYASLDDAAVRRLVADATALDAATETRRDGGLQRLSELPIRPGSSRGQALFQALGCAACHADPKTGPSLSGLTGRTVRLVGGALVFVDASYLRRSILAPAAQVVFGYNPLMPTYDGYLAPGDLDALIAYLQAIPATPQHGRRPRDGR